MGHACPGVQVHAAHEVEANTEGDPEEVAEADAKLLVQQYVVEVLCAGDSAAHCVLAFPPSTKPMSSLEEMNFAGVIALVRASALCVAVGWYSTTISPASSITDSCR